MKNILILGATSGIAVACARHWATLGAKLCLAGRDRDRLMSLCQDLKIRGAAHVCCIEFDAKIADEKIINIVEFAIKELEYLDTCFIAHGMLPEQSACEQNPEQVAEVMVVNTTSVMLVLLELARYFEHHQKSGHIGVITSVAGDRGRRSNYIYGASKAALSVFCEGLRVRLLPLQVGVTDIRPGWIRTAMTAGLTLPAALVAEPEAVVKPIVQAMLQKQPVVYVPWFWQWIMLLIKNLPRAVFSRLKF
jgi:short-subunit dehydrogenase